MPRRSDYDYEEFSQPIGGWIGVEDKPTPRRTDRAFKVGAIAAAVLAFAVSIGWLLQATTASPSASGAAILAALSLVAACLAYGLVRALGMIVVGIVGMALDGPEVTLSRRVISHDIRLGATWASLLEVALFLAAAGMIVFSGIDAVKNQSLYSACVFVLLFALSFWPYLRHRIKHGAWP